MAAAKKTKSTKPIEEPCPICLDPYTATIRKSIECPQCHEKTCSKCIEKHILSIIEDPHCAHCRFAWSRAFLGTFCTQTFLTKTYYAHRQEILINREKSYLPQLMVAAEAELEARKVEQEITRSYKKEDKIRREYEMIIRQFEAERSQLRARAYRLRNGDVATDDKKEVRKFIRRCTVADCKGFLSSVWKCGICDNWTCPDCFEVKGKDKDVAHTCRPEMVETANLIKKDTKPCPACGEMIMKADGCFAADTPVLAYDGSIIMSQNIKVGDCLIGDDGEPREVTDTVRGEDMLYEVKQTNGISYIVNSKHTLVLKETSTGEPIEFVVDDYLRIADNHHLHGYNAKSSTLSRIAVRPVGRGTYYGWSVTGNKRFVLKDFTVVRNCDQMWCTSCHTPFSWKTGAIVTSGTVHNPHYYQWLRNGGGGGGAAGGQHPGHIPCGGFPDPWAMRRSVRLVPAGILEHFMNIYRTCAHISDYERNRYAVHHQVHDTQRLGVRYLLKELTEDEWKAILAREERDRQKSKEIRDILDAFNGAAIDLMRRIDLRPDNPYTREEGLTLILQINDELEALRKYITEELFKVSKSFNCSVPYINDDWNICHGNVTAIKRTEKAVAAAAAPTPANGGCGAPTTN